MSVNRVLLIGNLGKDPETKATVNSMVSKFTLATTSFQNNTEETAWHNIEVWGKTAENCAKHLSKGSKVYLEGRIKYNSWEKDGVKHYRTDIIADRVTFLSSKVSEKTEKTEKRRDGVVETRMSFTAGNRSDDDYLPF